MGMQTAQIHACMEEYYTSKHASLSYILSEKAGICTVNAAYMPMAEFQALFEIAGELVRKEGLTKFIFDKRKLIAFHQPSMDGITWYGKKRCITKDCVLTESYCLRISCLNAM